jgi:uncharacterized protein with FMN-binding domain
MAASGITVGALFLFPTSTNRTGLHSSVRHAPAGVVRQPSASTSSLVVNGKPVDTQYGPVQVQIRVRGHRILAAVATDYPQGTSRDQEINSYAIPMLERSTVARQSAHVDTVSGATYTSDGYRRSLQSALDAAHLS